MQQQNLFEMEHKIWNGGTSNRGQPVFMLSEKSEDYNLRMVSLHSGLWRGGRTQGREFNGSWGGATNERVRNDYDISTKCKRL